MSINAIKGFHEYLFDSAQQEVIRDDNVKINCFFAAKKILSLIIDFVFLKRNAGWLGTLIHDTITFAADPNCVIKYGQVG